MAPFKREIIRFPNSRRFIVKKDRYDKELLYQTQVFFLFVVSFSLVHNIEPQCAKMGRCCIEKKLLYFISISNKTCHGHLIKSWGNCGISWKQRTWYVSYNQQKVKFQLWLQVNNSIRLVNAVWKLCSGGGCFSAAKESINMFSPWPLRYLGINGRQEESKRMTMSILISVFLNHSRSPEPTGYRSILLAHTDWSTALASGCSAQICN